MGESNANLQRSRSDMDTLLAAAAVQSRRPPCSRRMYPHGKAVAPEGLLSMLTKTVLVPLCAISML